MISFITACLSFFGLSCSQLNEVPQKHDWECQYIITECYYEQPNQTVHYVDEIIYHDDGSISFIGEDGLVWKVPYPYYSIEEYGK